MGRDGGRVKLEIFIKLNLFFVGMGFWSFIKRGFAAAVASSNQQKELAQIDLYSRFAIRFKDYTWEIPEDEKIE